MAEFSMYIQGRGGNIGQDLLKVAAEQDIVVCEDKNQADFVALCVPSTVANEILAEEQSGPTIIDFSGAAKRKYLGQYGLMRSSEEPWAANFDPKAHIFGNPGCIAGATLLGLDRSGVVQNRPHQLAIFAIGGSSYAHDIDQSDVRLANRLMEHPHVTEVNTGLRGLARVVSFMPVAAGSFERGLMVGVSGMTDTANHLDYGVRNLHIGNVAGSANLNHRLEVQGEMSDGYQFKGFHFSLGVVADNLRFVTQNAIDLMYYVTKNT